MSVTSDRNNPSLKVPRADRAYEIPEKLPNENSWDWCKRVADAIPPEVIIRELMKYIQLRDKKKAALWSRIGHIFGHGSGVSSAIVEKWYPDHEKQSDQLNDR